MRHLARTPSITPARRGARVLFASLLSLALVSSGSASLAADDPAPDVGALVSEAVASDASLAPGDGAALAAPTADGAPGTGEVDGAAPATDAEAPPVLEAPPADGVEEPAAEDAAAQEPAAEEPAEAAEADAAPVRPLFVPPGDPAENQAKLIVTKGGDRTGTGAASTTVTPLAGATFEFFRVGSATELDGGTSVGTCTTDETGECGVFVPLETETGNFFYAVETAAPAGWTIPIRWNETELIRYNTGNISQGGTAESRTVTLPGPGRTWADVRANNDAPAVCGIDLAIVADLSNSITRTPAILAEYKAAGVGFVDALTGTPSRIALYSFATDAPATGTVAVPLTSVATAGGASVINAVINSGGPTPLESQGGTNWDRGFHQVAESGVAYDIVLFMTDGQPTYHRTGVGPGDVASIREVEEAIHSANAVKATGAQVIVVGIGPDAFLPPAPIRMSLISGPEEGVDWYRTEFADLAATLQEIASSDCAGTLSVVKEIENLDGEIVPGGAGWTFSTETPGATPASATTDDTGAVNFDVAYPAGQFTLPVTVTETVNEGYTLAPQDGSNAVCRNTVTDEVVAVTNSGDAGFTVDVPAASVISCVVRNREVPPDYDELVVTKTAETSYQRDYDWDIEKLVQGADRQEVPAGEDATFTYDVTVTPSSPSESGHAVRGIIRVENPNEVAFTGVDITDALPNGTCTVAGGTDVTVAAGGFYEVFYDCSLPTADAGAAGTNTATATWDPQAFPGTAGSAQATASFDFADAAVTITDATVVVTDSVVDLEAYDDGTQVGNVVSAEDGETVFTYDITWPGVPGECETYDNTATITNAIGPLSVGVLAVDQSSTETVTVCAGVDLEVEKNVVLSFDRTYLWDIEKSAGDTEVTVGPDGTATFDYTVTVTPQEYTDSGWAMTGMITVTNPNSWLDISADVVDAVDVGGGATCTVAGGADVLVAAGQTLDLSYTCTFTSQPEYEGTNTATVTWGDDAPTPNHSAVGTADVTSDGWSQTPINAAVQVVDDQTDPANPVALGTANWNAEGTPSIFRYSLTHEGVPGTCVELTNTAWIVQTEQEATETVTVCEQAPVEVAKTADASVDRTYDWDIEKSVEDTDVVIDENGQATFSYLVEAIPGGSTDSGWELAGEITVTNPNDFGPITVTVTDVVDVGGGAVCTVAGGEDVEIAAGATQTFDYDCTFTSEPDYEGLNTATVAWTDADGADQSSGAEAGVALEVDGETDLVVDVYDDKVDLDEPELLGQATWNAAGTPIPFPYEVTHQGVGGACVELTNTAWVDITTGEDPEDTATVELCVPGVLDLDKTATGADQNPDGSWTVTYDVVVTNGATFDGRYSLSDTLEYGEGITPASAMWELAGTDVSGAWDLTTGNTTVLATDMDIEAGAIHTYEVSVVADVAAGVVGTDAGLCTDDDEVENGGFLNAATLTAFQQTLTDRDCAEPVAPTIDKVAGELVENEDGTWDVTYTLVVDNPSDTQDLAYDLSDTLGFAEGVVIEDATVSRGETTYEDWDGVDETQIVSGEALPAGATHTYTVTVTVSLASVIDEDDRACGVNGSNAGQGLFNGVVLTSGNDDYDDEACVPIPEPELELDKVATAADQNADGSWTVTYQVVVSNGSIGGMYDLSDTLEYGEGITPTAATWELLGTDVDGAWDLAAGVTAMLADDRPIEGGASHTYLVTVTAEVGAGVIGTDPGLCTDDDEVENGGFLNAANLTAYDQDITERDCAEPSVPDFEKVFGSAVQRADSTWDVTYTLEVDNSANGATAYYTLHDMPDFAEGIIILDQSVQDVSGAEPVAVEWDGEAAIVTDVEIAAGETHRYEVTFHVDVPATVPAENLTCDPQATEGGSGFFNSATLTTGNDVIPGQDCGDVTESVVPDVEKSLAEGYPIQGADGTWRIEYLVTVSTPQGNTLAAAYELFDTLDFGEGIEILAASIEADDDDTPDPLDTWTGMGDTTAVTDGEVVLPAGQTHTYRVRVVADLDPAIINTEAGLCFSEEQGTAGGFLNRAELRTDTVIRTDEACGEPLDASWTISKSSDPVSGSQVDPGDVITYTVTLRATGEGTPVGLRVVDDLSNVLNNADLVGTISASVGGTSVEGDQLFWDVGSFTGTATLTYQVQVDDDAWSVTLRNVVTGEGWTDAVCVGTCSTTHTTPPEPGDGGELPGEERPEPTLPPSGAEVIGLASLGVLLALGGAVAAGAGRRRYGRG